MVPKKPGILFHKAMFDDNEIKILIHTYQNTGSGLQKIKEVLAEFIYHFPAIGFDVFDEDKKGDFYLYISERLHRILEKYKIQENSTFKTYFYLVLRRHYLNFIKTTSQKVPEKKVDLEKSYVYWEEDFPDKKFRLEQISMIFASLQPKERLLLKLRCPEFLQPEDMKDISKHFNIAFSVLLKRIDIIFNDLAKKEDKNRSSKNLSMSVTSPRAIGKFLDVKAQLISKWLFNIRKTIHEKMGEAYVS